MAVCIITRLVHWPHAAAEKRTRVGTLCRGVAAHKVWDLVQEEWSRTRLGRVLRRGGLTSTLLVLY